MNWKPRNYLKGAPVTVNFKCKPTKRRTFTDTERLNWAIQYMRELGWFGTRRDIDAHLREAAMRKAGKK